MAVRRHLRLPTFKCNGDAQARALLIKRKVKLIYGGFGSGKSILHAPHYIEQSEHDTDQIHGLFTNTYTQFIDDILPDLEERLLPSGIAIKYDREPPPEWFRAWEKARKPYPRLRKYRGILTLSTGLHVVCG